MRKLTFLTAILACGACGSPPTLPLAPRPHPTAKPTGSIVAIGDTQRTSWQERFVFGREQNDVARVALIEKLAKEETPAFVVHLGDMVSAGGDSKNWGYFDALMSPLRERGIPVLPVIGNHEYWGDERNAMREIQSRFPQLREGTYYAMRQSDLGLVWLNTNLEGHEASAQTQWLEETLAIFEQDPGVRGILVFTHHPAFTNGKARYPSSYVTKEVLPPFFASRKAVAMISAHVHGYERFVERGKTFVVSGGGGGPRVEYHIGPEYKFVPAYVTPTGAMRAFNYVVIDEIDGQLRFTVKCLPFDAVCPDGVLERFDVPLP